MHETSIPTRNDIIRLFTENVIGTEVVNNSHRGDLVEMMVLAALQPEWRFVGLGWHPWDLQRGGGESRVRLQVKQTAALQLWGRTKRPSVSFGWKKNKPSYFERDNPGEAIESEGWFCEIFVVGVHQCVDPETVDQVDPRQWRFLVIPATDLPSGTDSMVLTKAISSWPLIEWRSLRQSVDTLANGV